jgi:hypothetical protein
MSLVAEVLEATNYIWHQILNWLRHQIAQHQIPAGIKFLIA